MKKELTGRRVWDFMEARCVARFPRSVHRRIPNPKGAERAAEKGHLMLLLEAGEGQGSALARFSGETRPRLVLKCAI